VRVGFGSKVDEGCALDRACLLGLVALGAHLGGTHDRGTLAVVCCCKVFGICCLFRVVLHEHGGVFRLSDWYCASKSSRFCKSSS
jgi:hypothetical protein